MTLDPWEIALLMEDFEFYDQTHIQFSTKIGKNLL